MKLSSRFLALGSAAAVLLGAGSAFAQDTAPLPQTQYVLDIGLGAMAKPRYDGSDSYLISPMPIFAVSRFYLPGLGQVADGQKQTGLFFFPSFNFVGERKPSDDKDLRGTRKINWALEAGLGAGYQAEYFRVFAELRQGFNGHTGQVGQLGADLITRPMDRLEWSIGPRAGFASSKYMDTYFSVSAAESAASGLPRYKAGGGFKSVGLETRFTYDLNDKVKLHLQGGYDRLIGDAGKSPLVKAGSKDQFNIGTGVTYRFSFDLF
ncbi:MipA/OmpV family protein [Microvirga tunisiensis]|uniref:MipA/OmpV family protein n=2 Tax=Pannonibacter tanglangensis TaxID=2750084 RepID=A0ABW9ZLQ1_9HYPH|nr:MULTISPECIES: MipA/OmpV family protein [unclassified Pannonibacter]NBN65860.1 MipA/OmpV family protein [Pannonibacter sp. XCT-34]NBN80378.1 MipA/OmpV family protein [Pannonibacter sp. XCT-53]